MATIYVNSTFYLYMHIHHICKKTNLFNFFKYMSIFYICLHWRVLGWIYMYMTYIDLLYLYIGVQVAFHTVEVNGDWGCQALKRTKKHHESIIKVIRMSCAIFSKLPDSFRCYYSLKILLDSSSPHSFSLFGTCSLDLKLQASPFWFHRRNKIIQVCSNMRVSK